ncbi:hypothetical protein LP421_04015 (plasmid) [Rhizobium sp. RCAM05350]|nr:hypothetical protein LP421_04015 [Rhizobium sp. RCAM05350]
MTHEVATVGKVDHPNARNCLIKDGYSATSGRVLSENCATAQRDGSESHGLFRVKDYVATIQSGYVNGDPSSALWLPLAKREFQASSGSMHATTLTDLLKSMKKNGVR